MSVLPRSEQRTGSSGRLNTNATRFRKCAVDMSAQAGRCQESRNLLNFTKAQAASCETASR
jgi:hypothetical protein